MRINEIYGGGQVSPPLKESTDAAMKEVLRSVLLPLKSQKIDKITIKQLFDIVRADPALKGIDFDQRYLVDIVAKSKAVSKVQADPENSGEMTVYFDFPVGDRQISKDQAEREQEKIRKSAVKQVKDKMK